MLTLTQIYAEAWSLLDPDVADVIVAAVPTQRTSDAQLEHRSEPGPVTRV